MVRFAVFASAAVLASAADAFKVTIMNSCSSDIELFTRLASVFTDECDTIAPGASIVKTIGKGFEGHFRNGTDDAATLIEFATKGDLNLAWYDVGIIPPRLNPGYEYCSSLKECKAHSTSGKGFNTPVQVTPTSNSNGDNCRELTCLADECEDAYNYPKDDIKTHSCAFGTDFIITFCPSGNSYPTEQEQSSPEETTVPNTTAIPNVTAAPVPLTAAPVTEAPVTEAPAAPVTEAPVTEAPAAPITEAPVTEAPAASVTEAPVTEAPAPVDNEVDSVPTENDGVKGESETMGPEASSSGTPTTTDSVYDGVNGESETVAPDATQIQTSAPEGTPAATPTATKPKYCD